jgi:hypothetical protein
MDGLGDYQLSVTCRLLSSPSDHQGDHYCPWILDRVHSAQPLPLFLRISLTSSLDGEPGEKSKSTQMLMLMAVQQVDQHSRCPLMYSICKYSVFRSSDTNETACRRRRPLPHIIARMLIRADLRDEDTSASCLFLPGLQANHHSCRC